MSYTKKERGMTFITTLYHYIRCSFFQLIDCVECVWIESSSVSSRDKGRDEIEDISGLSGLGR